jgi:multiple antibiotic resistance protein
MTAEAMQLLQGALLVIAALFPIVNPVGNAPFFLALTADQDARERGVLARKVAINGFFLLLAAIFIGDYVLHFFGVSLPIVQISGGLVVATLAWRLLNKDDVEHAAPAAHTVGQGTETRAFYPLTLPLTVGPGAISVAITIGANFPSTLQPFVADALSAVVGAFVVCVTTYLCFRYSERLTKALGPSGTAVVMRLSAFILVCIGVQILWNGIDALFGISGAGHPTTR